jgi:hypothetical protein
MHLSLVLVVEDVGQVATAAVLAVVHGGHEDTGTTLEICQQLDYIALKMICNLRRELGTRGGDARSFHHHPPCST